MHGYKWPINCTRTRTGWCLYECTVANHLLTEEKMISNRNAQQETRMRAGELVCMGRPLLCAQVGEGERVYQYEAGSDGSRDEGEHTFQAHLILGKVKLRQQQRHAADAISRSRRNAARPARRGGGINVAGTRFAMAAAEIKIINDIYEAMELNNWSQALVMGDRDDDEDDDCDDDDDDDDDDDNAE